MNGTFEEAIAFSLWKLGYSEMRQHQKDVLEKMLLGSDSLLVAPTGMGKSFLFEAMPFAMEYIKRQKNEDPRCVVLVISPLISLMKLQAKKLKNKNISAAYLQVIIEIIEIPYII
jgi:ATP-dependent DNA helicase RecQ